MGYIQFDAVNLAFGDRCILSDVKFTISPKSRIALCGANGSGKSTLMKCVAGIQDYDSGRMIKPDGTRISYLPQSGIVYAGRKLREEAMQAFSALEALDKEAHTITEELAEHSDKSQKLLVRYQEIQDILESAEWQRREARTEQVLTGLGFSRNELDCDVSTFSGGWQMRIALARILLESPDILLLDEPTNYLDIEAREWLRDFIKSYPGGVMLVSHDRAFLDSTCNQVAEVFMTKLRLFKGCYSDYEQFQAKEMENLVERWKRQQGDIARMETFINRFRYKDSKAVQVQSRVKMLEKLERIEIPPALKRIQLRFPQAPQCGKAVIRAEGLERCYGDNIVFSRLNLELPRGSRMAVVGANGAGKTTLLKIIAGHDSNFEGSLNYGSGVKSGYFSQDQEAVLNPSLTVFEEAGSESTEGEQRLRSLLGGFLFSGDDIHKKVGILSGGERSRLALMKILLKPVNLLILDEPTNHLDITSKDILLEALKDFGGTLVIVSHDRYFLERIADRVLEIHEGKGTTHLGDYSLYRWRKDSSGSQSAPEPVNHNHKKTNNSREEQLKARSRMAKLRKELDKTTALLEVNEANAAKLRRQLELPENYSNVEKANRLSQRLKDVEQETENISRAWEKAALELEQEEQGGVT